MRRINKQSLLHFILTIDSLSAKDFSGDFLFNCKIATRKKRNIDRFFLEEIIIEPIQDNYVAHLLKI